jgi:hypothetical protein
MKGARPDAEQTAAKLAAFIKEHAPDHYQTACAFSRWCAETRQLQDLPEPVRQELETILAKHAMQFLRKAADAGLLDASKMNEDKVLDPLRQREDFQKLRRELESRTKGDGD